MTRFQIAPLWKPFSEASVLIGVFERCSVVQKPKRIKTYAYSNENESVLMGPKNSFMMKFSACLLTAYTVVIWRLWLLVMILKVLKLHSSQRGSCTFQSFRKNITAIRLALTAHCHHTLTRSINVYNVNITPCLHT